jgi:hypothetical protein
MVKWQPMFRKTQPPIDPTTGTLDLAPLTGYKACVLVEQTTQDGQTVARLRLYVNANDVGLATATVQYKPVSASGFWIVDIPEPNELNLDEIAVAIANAAPNLPPPPIIWD